MKKRITGIAVLLCLAVTVLYAGEAQDLFRQGRALANKGENDKALEAFSQATMIKPDYKAVYLAMAVVYVNMKRNYEAIDSLNRVISIDPDNANAHYILAMVYEEVGNNFDAVRTWKR